MGGYIVCFLLGACVGMFVTALCVAAKDGEDENDNTK